MSRIMNDARMQAVNGSPSTPPSELPSKYLPLGLHKETLTCVLTATIWNDFIRDLGTKSAHQHNNHNHNYNWSQNQNQMLVTLLPSRSSSFSLHLPLSPSLACSYVI